jgi:hypothetical protein
VQDFTAEGQLRGWRWRRTVRVACRRRRRSACTGHCVKQLRAVPTHVFGDIFSGEENPNMFFSKCQRLWLCVFTTCRIRVRCVSVVASRIDNFVIGENGFALCGRGIRGRIRVVSQWIWVPLHINGICEQWRRARGCGEPDEGSRSFLRIVARPSWRYWTLGKSGKADNYFGGGLRRLISGHVR